MTEETVIKCEDLSFRYEDSPDGKYVLKNISTEIARGSFVAILGHNGSGKSTFAKLCNMILVPTSGSITVLGTKVTKDGISEDEIYRIRQKIGMVFQNPDNQLVATIVEEDVAFGPENLGVAPAEIRARVDKALEIVGMSQFARHSPHQLSGGQKQRVAIAGILAMSPDIIVFDESTAMLDPVGRKEIMDTIKRLNKEEKKTILLITHYMEEAVEADRVIVMEDGSILLDGTPKQVFRETALLKKTGLDTPQVTELMQSMAEDGLDFPRDILNPEEAADAVERLIQCRKQSMQ